MTEALGLEAIKDEQLLLARQPIFDRSLQVFAYELLHRSTDPDYSNVQDGDEASSQVLLDAFGDIGLKQITAGHPAFINFTPHLIVNPPPLEPADLIIEVLEDVQPTPHVIEGLRKLKHQGFRIALDDFEHREELTALIDLADIIKLDVLSLGHDGTREQISKLKGLDVALLAEKIEDWETFNLCKELGCTYFQGFFLARPQPFHGKRNLIGGQALPELMAQLTDPDASPQRIADAISMDPVISYQVIRLVNSALYSPRSPIEALRDAITFLGVERIRGWLLVLAMSKGTNKPRELLHFALIRAKMCELLSEQVGHDVPARAFTLGVLSTIDAFLDKPLDDALQGMNVSAELNTALLGGEGPLGIVLEAALAFERADMDQVPWDALASLDCDQTAVENSYLDSLSWAYSTISGM